MVARHEVPAGVAHHAEPEPAQGGEDVCAEALVVGVRAVWLVDPLVDSAAHVLQEPAEQPRIHATDRELAVQPEGRRVHGGSARSVPVGVVAEPAPRRVHDAVELRIAELPAELALHLRRGRRRGSGGRPGGAPLPARGRSCPLPLRTDSMTSRTEFPGTGTQVVEEAAPILVEMIEHLDVGTTQGRRRACSRADTCRRACRSRCRRWRAPGPFCRRPQSRGESGVFRDRGARRCCRLRPPPRR